MSLRFNKIARFAAALGGVLYAGMALAGVFPSSNYSFQISGQQRAASIGDWYTTATSSSTDRLHRFLIEITPAQLAAAGGSLTITVEDAESYIGSGPCDEVDGASCTGAPGATVGDPTRYTLRTANGVTVLQSQTFASNSPNGSTASFTVSQAGLYQLTAEDGGTPISGNNTTNLNNDDNSFRISVPFSGGTAGGNINVVQGSFQQDTGAAINVSLYFMVGPSLTNTSISLRNFDLDTGVSSLTYVRPNSATQTGTISGDGVWNNGGTLNSGADTVTVSNTVSSVSGDAGAWGINLANFTPNNQVSFEALQGALRLPVFVQPPQRAGFFTMTPGDVMQTQIGVPVDHGFTVTNLFFTSDIFNFSLTGTSPNYTVQLRTDPNCDGNGADGSVLTDTDGDGNLDSGIVAANTSGTGTVQCFVLRTTPNAGASTSDTTRVSAQSFMDNKVNPASNTTLFVDKTTLIPPRISKSFSPNPIATTGVATLTFTLTNVNSLPFTGAQFTDTLPTTPAAMTVSPTPNASTSNCGAPTWSPAAGAGSLTFSNGTLPANSSCTVRVDVTAPVTGQFNNTSGNVSATAPVTVGSATSTGNTANAGPTVQAQAPLSVAKSFSPSPIATGGVSILTLTITNPNPGLTIGGVAISDTYPTGLTNTATPAPVTNCTGATLTGGAANGNTIGITNGSLLGGASCTITVNVTSAIKGSYVNTTGVVSSNNGPGNTASATIVVEAPPTVAKSFSPSTINVNGVSILTLVLSNPNSVVLSGAALTDNYLAGMRNTSTPNASTTCGPGTVSAAANGTSLTLSNGTIPANGTCTITVEVTRSTAGSTNNTIPAGGLTTNGGVSNVAPSNTATLTASANSPPTISKSFSPSPIQNGGTSTLTITVGNPNPTATLTGVAVTDTYPNNLTNASPSQPELVCSPGSYGNFTGGVAGQNTIGLEAADIQPGGSCALTVNVTSSNNGTYNNTTGTVTSSNGGNGGTASASLVVQAALVAPQIEKSFSPNSLGVGGVSRLTLTITNPNNAALPNVKVLDTYPAGLVNANPQGILNTCGGNTTPGGDIAGGAAGGTTFGLQGNNNDLDPNQVCTVSINVTSASAATYTNTTGAVTSTSNGGGGTVLTGNTASDSVTFDRPGISKSFSKTTLISGEIAVLTITLTNPTSVAFTINTPGFTDVFPTSPGAMTVASPLTTSNNCGGTLLDSAGGSLAANDVGVRLNGGTIPPNGSCTVTVAVTASAAGTYNNTIAAGNLSTSGGTNANAAVASLSVPSRPAVSKVFTPNSIGAGGASTLTITLSNNNAAIAATGASFVDTLPAGIAVVGGASTNCAGGTASATSNSVSLSGGTIPAGSPGTCTVSVNVSSNLPGGYTNTIPAGGLTASTGSNANPASAPFTVLGNPAAAKNFSPSVIGTGGNSVLTITLSNPNVGAAITGATFTDTYPAGIVNSATPAGATSCGGGVVLAAANGSTVALTNGTIPAGGTCTVTVNVTGTVAGTFTNTIPAGGISSANAGSSTTPASAQLTVGAPAITVVKSSVAISDPYNTTNNPKRIPGGFVNYSIVVTNSGAGQVDNNSTKVMDPIPANTELYVGNLGGPGSGPVGFVQGAPSSGLTYSFVSLASGADDLEFSNNNGVSFTYVPVADANGVDTAVTNIRMSPKGIFAGDTVAGSPSPNFTLTFRVRIK